MKILILGSNPSNKSPDNSAFSPETRSGKTIREWLSPYPDVSFDFANVVDTPTKNNKPISMSTILANIHSLSYKINGYDGIITVGKIASEAVSLAKTDIKTLKLGHPSGRNRSWNNNQLREERREAIRDFIESIT